MERKRLVALAALVVGVITWRIGAMQSEQSAPQAAQEATIVFVTNDGERIPLAREVALRFGTIKNMLEDVAVVDAIPLRVSAAIFRRLLIDMGQMQGTYQKSAIDNLASLEAAIYLENNELMDRYAKEVVDDLTSDALLQLLHAKNPELLTLISNLSTPAKNKIYDQIGYKDFWLDVLNFRQTDEIKSATFSSDSAAALIVSDNRLCGAYQVNNKWQAGTFVAGQPITFASFTAEGHDIMFAGDSIYIYRWNSNVKWAPEIISLSESDENDLKLGTLSSDARQVFIYNKHGKTRRLKNEGDRWQVTVYDDQPTVKAAVFSPDGKKFAMALENNVLLDEEDNGGRQRYPIPGSFNSLSFSPDSRFLIMKSNNAAVIIYKMQPQQLERSRLPHGVQMISFAPNVERLMFTRGSSLWVGQCIARMREEFRMDTEEAVTAAAWSPDSKKLAAVSGRFVRMFLDIVNPNQRFVFRHETRVNSVAFSPDSKKITVATEGNRANILDIDRHSTDYVIKHNGPVRASLFSPDGKRVVTASDDQTAKVAWKDEKNRWLENTIMHDAMVRSAVFSPDSKKIMTISRDNKVKIAALVQADTFEQAFLIMYLEWAKAQGKQVMNEGWVRAALKTFSREMAASVKRHFKGVLRRKKD